MEEEINKICIGDIVYFKSTDLGNTNSYWICAEGHLNDAIFCSSMSEEFHHGLWEVYIQYQYSSMNEYLEALLLTKLTSGNEVAKGSAFTAESQKDEKRDHHSEMLHQLEKAAANEQKLNERIYLSKIGTPVAFGDTIQLRHVQSKRFLSVSATDLATQERENMRVMSILNGDPYSCISILPKMQMKEGAIVNSGFECCLRVNERPGEFLRCAKPAASGKHVSKLEVNCSLERTFWSINVYQNGKDFGKVISAGKPVSLSDASTFSYLAINDSEIDVDTIDPNAVATAILKPPVLVTEEAGYHVGVGSLWRTEKKNVSKGGPFIIGQDKLLLCHLNSGMYLHSKKADGTLIGVKDRVRAGEFNINFAKDSNVKGMELSAVLEEGIPVTLSNTVYFGKQSSAMYVGLGSNIVTQFKDVASMRASHDIKNAVELIASGSIHTKHDSDIYFGVDANRCIINFRMAAAEVSSDDAFDSPHMILASQAYKALLSCMDQLCEFLNERHIKARQEKLDHGYHSFGVAPDTAEKLMARQSMMKEQGVLDSIMDILEECVQHKFDCIKASTAGFSNANVGSAGHGARPKPTEIKSIKGNHQGNGKQNASGGGSKPSSLFQKAAMGFAANPKLRDEFMKDVINKGSKGDRDGLGGLKKRTKTGKMSLFERMSSYISKPRMTIRKSSNEPIKGEKSYKTTKKDDGGDDDDDDDDGDDDDDDDDSESSSSSSSDDDEELARRPTISAWMRKSRGLSADKKDEEEKRKADATVQGARNMFGLDIEDKKTESTNTNAMPKLMDVIFGTKNTTPKSEPGGMKTRRISGIGSNRRLSKPDTAKKNSIILPSNVREVLGESMGAKDGYQQGKRRTMAGDELADMMLQSLLKCIQNHQGNQVYISDRISVLLLHVHKQEYAVNCLQELLRANEVILQTKIRQDEINIFIDLLCQSPMNVSFLQLLQSVCTSPHSGGVDKTQQMVSNALWGFGNGLPPPHLSVMPKNPAAIASAPDPGKVHGGAGGRNQGLCVNMFMKYEDGMGHGARHSWVSGQTYSYFPPHDSADLDDSQSGFLGYSLVVKGIPDVFVNFYDPSISQAKSMLKLFGSKDEIPFTLLTEVHVKGYINSQKLRELNREANQSKKAESNRRTSSSVDLQISYFSQYNTTGEKPVPKLTITDEFRVQVAEYMLAELQLVADLCLDRNYVSINVLEDCFPYDMLLTILLNESVAPHFKAAICRILRCLWIDREPQIAAVFPRLIRSSKTSDNTPGIENSDFHKFHKGSPFSFCLLQQLLSEYFRLRFDRNECDELSVEMAQVLYMLIDFGFYSKTEQLEDIILPLMLGLDHANYLSWSSAQVESIERNKSARETLKKRLEDRRRGQTSLDKEDPDDEATIRRGSSGSAVIGGLSRLISFQGNLDSVSSKSSNKGAQVVPIEEEDDHVDKRLESEIEEEDHLHMDRVVFKTHRQMLAARRKEEEIKHSSLHTAEGKFLAYTESTQGMVMLMIIVIISVVLSILQVMDRDRYNTEEISILDYICTIFFMVELVLRCYSVVRVREGGLIPYFMEPLNLLDLSLVVLDVVIISIGSDDSDASAGRIARFARVIRFFRMLRIMRVLRLMKVLARQKRGIEGYELPERYSDITPEGGTTFTTILKSINLIYSRIQDNSLEMIIQAFQEWVKLEQEGEPVDAKVVIEKYIERDNDLGLIPVGFDKVLADLIMYDNRDLTNEALHLLMLHKNKRHILLDLSKDIQIVYSPKVENKLAEAKQSLQSMRRIAEKYELWQGLKSPEDLETHKQLNTLIERMIKLMKKINEEKTLAVKSEWIPDEEVQNLLRNLSAMSTFMTVIEALYDGGREEPPAPIKETMTRCMMMVSTFVMENPRNQLLAFSHLYFFVDRVDDGLDSARVVKCILEGNSDLIKRCHKRCTDEFAQKIFGKGRKPDYMEMFLGLTSRTTETLDGGMRPVHNNISRYLTSREWQVRILQWCCQADSAGYTKRLAEMEKVMPETGKYINNEDLPDTLRYHIYLLEVLASCSLGPKLQAIYQFDDMVHAIIDERTIFNVKIALAKCVEEIMSSAASQFIGAEYMWLFLDYFSDYLQTLSSQMDRLFRRPHSSELVLIKTQIGTFLEICLSIVHSYFTSLDLTVFGEILYHDVSIQHTQRVESDILTTIRNIYNSIRVFLERFPLYIGASLSEKGNLSLVAIARHSDTITYNYDGPDPVATAKRTQRASVTLADVQQLQLRHKFAEFTRILQEEDWKKHDESIFFFMNLPSIDKDDGELNVESLISKLMSNLRSYVKYMPNSRVLSAHLEESIWLLRTLRRLFEKFMGISIEFTVDLDLDECKVNHDTEKWRGIFNDCGVTRLCIDFIAVGMDPTLQLESINLLVVMLARRGGSASVQEEAYRALKESDSTLFFLSLKEILGDILMWYQKEAEGVEMLQDEDSVLILPDETIVLTLIQSLCEGDFIPMKNYMREQEGNKENINILNIMCSILDFLSRRESPLFTHVAITLVNTIRSTIHGPCRENQRYLVMNTEVLVCINRLMRSSRPKTHVLTVAWNKDVETLKACVVDLLRSLVEGSIPGSYQFDRVLSSIELNVLSLLLMPSPDEDHDVLEYGFTQTEAKYMVFLSTLEAPGIMDTLSPATLMKKDETIGAVEIRWQKQTYKIYYHKPKILDDLSNDYLEDFHDIDAASQEDKLVEFLKKTKALYIEAKHQQLLKQYGLSYLWARRRNISWFVFILAGALNIMLLVFYKRDYYHNVTFTDDVNDAFTALLIIQILTSSMMALLYVSVRMPSKYLSHIDNGATHYEALVDTILDPLPLWYCSLVAFSILAYSYNKLFSAVFLLEFVVLDGTTQYLLKAVSLPYRNLFATFLILGIAIHIFSGMYYELFSYDLEHNHVQPIYDLWSSLRLALTYGLRGEYGVDHEFYVTIGPRMWLDLAFYFIILAILRHIFFAIIVETFGQLREEKNEREEKSHNSCFICGVARHDYERLGLTASFQEHRNVDHAPENYVHFIFSVLEQRNVDDLGVEMYVRKCIRSRDRWENISWIPIGIDKMYAMRPGVRKQEGTGDESLEVYREYGKKSSKRDDDDDDDDDHHKEDEVDDGGDRSPNGAAVRGLNLNPNDDDLDRPRISRISSFSQAAIMGTGAGGLNQNAKLMNELTQAISAIGSQISSVNNRLENIEQNSSIRPNTYGVVETQSGKALSPPHGNPPYSPMPLRQPLPSSKQRHPQLKGPTLGAGESTGSALTAASTVANSDVLISVASADTSSRPRYPVGDETKDGLNNA